MNYTFLCIEKQIDFLPVLTVVPFDTSFPTTGTECVYNSLFCDYAEGIARNTNTAQRGESNADIIAAYLLRRKQSVPKENVHTHDERM